MAAGGQVEVGAAELDDAPQDVVDVERRRPARGPAVAVERLGGEGDAERPVLVGRFPDADGSYTETSLPPLIGPAAGTLETSGPGVNPTVVGWCRPLPLGLLGDFDGGWGGRSRIGLVGGLLGPSDRPADDRADRGRAALPAGRPIRAQRRRRARQDGVQRAGAGDPPLVRPRHLGDPRAWWRSSSWWPSCSGCRWPTGPTGGPGCGWPPAAPRCGARSRWPPGWPQRRVAGRRPGRRGHGPGGGDADPLLAAGRLLPARDPAEGVRHAPGGQLRRAVRRPDPGRCPGAVAGLAGAVRPFRRADGRPRRAGHATPRAGPRRPRTAGGRRRRGGLPHRGGAAGVRRGVPDAVADPHAAADLVRAALRCRRDRRVGVAVRHLLRAGVRAELSPAGVRRRRDRAGSDPGAGCRDPPRQPPVEEGSVAGAAVRRPRRASCWPPASPPCRSRRTWPSCWS